eukprot:tig00021723_g23234.t1
MCASLHDHVQRGNLTPKSVGPPSVTVSSSGADAVLAAVSWNTTGASGTEPAYANVTVSCFEQRRGGLGLERDSGLGDGDGLGHGAVHAKTVENVTVGTPIRQSTTSVTVPVSWALSALLRGRRDADGLLASGTITAGATSANVTVLGLPEMGASYTITCSGANLTAYAGTVTGAAPDFTPGAASSTMSTTRRRQQSLFAKSVGAPSVTVSSSGADAVLAGCLEYDGGVGHGAGVRERDRELLEQRRGGLGSNATVASETGTGSPRCVHAKTVENVTVGTPIPQSTTSVTVPVSGRSRRGTVTGAALTSHRAPVKHDEHELVDGASLFAKSWGAVGDGLVERADAVLAAVQSHVTSCAATVYLLVPGGGVERHGVLDVHAKTVENVTVGTPIPQSTTSVTVPVSWALSAVGYSGETWRRRTGRGGELLRGRRDADGLPGERHDHGWGDERAT